MKTLIGGLILSVSLLGGFAAADDHAVSQSSSVTAAAVPSGYEYNVSHNGQSGRLLFGTDEVTFYPDNHDKSVAWNYNVLKKVRVDRGGHEITLVFHGGETHSYKLTGDQVASSDLSSLVRTRIAAAPRYQSWK